jgi:hypothetical protein
MQQALVTIVFAGSCSVSPTMRPDVSLVSVG